MISKRDRRLNIIKYADKQLIAWHDRVRNRDNQTCRVCGRIVSIKNGRTHHIEAGMAKRYETQNGLWLCWLCHEAIHSKNRRAIHIRKNPTLEPIINAPVIIFDRSKDVDIEGGKKL